jgi:uncharacterized protein (TIGR00251 family)
VCELKVRVTPRSSRNKVCWEDGSVQVWVHAAPADGEANKAVCELLAEALKVPKSTISIIRGETSREKTVDIPSLSLEQIQLKLNTVG